MVKRYRMKHLRAEDETSKAYHQVDYLKGIVDLVGQLQSRSGSFNYLT